MKKLAIVFVLGLIFSTNITKAQTGGLFQSGKYEVVVSASDAVFLAASPSLKTSLIDALFDPKKYKDPKYTNTGLLQVGYRYLLSNRVKLGVDFGYHNATLEMGEQNDRTMSKTTRILVLPVAQLSYLKSSWVDFYGNIGVGAIFGFEKVTNQGKTTPANSVGLAVQVNPLGLRVGKKFGGFLELGLGTKGLATAGLSYRF